MLYVYAISEPGVQIDVTGLGGATVRTVRVNGFDVLVSDHDELEPSAGVEEVWSHEAVVEAAGGSGKAVLPLRFGSVLGDGDAVAAFVEERSAEFARALDRVRGAVEFGVRAAVSVEAADGPEPSSDERPGTAYLMTRLAQKQRGDEIIDLVDRPLARLARDHVRLDRTIRDPSSVRLAYLVDEEAVAAFQERLRELEAELDHVRLTCTGPWPPYSFTEGQAP